MAKPLPTAAVVLPAASRASVFSRTCHFVTKGEGCYVLFHKVRFARPSKQRIENVRKLMHFLLCIPCWCAENSCPSLPGRSPRPQAAATHLSTLMLRSLIATLQMHQQPDDKQKGSLLHTTVCSLEKRSVQRNVFSMSLLRETFPVEATPFL